MPFFMVSLIEHKTDVEYNVCMQIFRYIAYIWEAYEKEMEQQHPGISKLKDFKYPPVLPIVYYEGSRHWTAPLDFKSRIHHGECIVGISVERKCSCRRGRERTRQSREQIRQSRCMKIR